MTKSKSRLNQDAGVGCRNCGCSPDEHLDDDVCPEPEPEVERDPVTEEECREYLESVWEKIEWHTPNCVYIGNLHLLSVDSAVAYTQKLLVEIAGIENQIKWLDSMVAGAKDCSWQGHMSRAKAALAEMRVGMKEGK